MRSRGASSVTAAENCAESATTVTPHTSSRGQSTASDLPNSVPTESAHAPERAIATLVTSVRPQRSPYLPPSQQPSAPLPTTAKVINAGTPLAVESPPRRTLSLAATNAAIQVHIAYSSHIWPRYPRFASDTARSPRMRGAALHLNGGAGAANGASGGTRSTSRPPRSADAAATASTGRHEAGGTAQRTRCGNAEPRVSAADTSAPATKPSCTEIVSHAAPVPWRCHSFESVGATAEALNHGAIPHSSAAASTASTRRGLIDLSDGPRTSREARTSPRDAPPAP